MDLGTNAPEASESVPLYLVVQRGRLAWLALAYQDGEAFRLLGAGEPFSRVVAMVEAPAAHAGGWLRLLRRLRPWGSRRKVLGIGLSRTGTTSLIDALRILGYRSEHYPMDRRTERDVLAGRQRIACVRRNDALGDIITIPFYKAWDELYPGSRFIYTRRDKESWLRSVQRHFQTVRARGPLSALDDFLIRKVYGSWNPGKDELSEIYDRHEADVTEYFAGRENLLILNILNGDGWDSLCPFLGKPVPDQPFPHRARQGSDVEERTGLHSGNDRSENPAH